MVAIANQWQGGWSVRGPITSGNVVVDPVGESVQVVINNGNSLGNWLACLVSWHGAILGPQTMSVGDDGHNLWIPLGTSADTGTTRTAIWVAPYARAVENVFVAPTGYVQGITVDVVELSGMPVNLVLDRVAVNTANAAGSITLTMPAPTQSVFVLAAVATDNLTKTLTPSGAGWTALTPVTSQNGADRFGDSALNSAYQTTAGGAAYTLTASAGTGSVDLSGVIVGIQLTPVAPSQPNPNWPRMQVQAGFGSGVGTPRDQIAWTDITGRYRGIDAKRGRQAELDQVQAGQATITLHNKDGALTPLNPASPYSPNVLLGTPVRVLATWQNVTYQIAWLNVDSWPQTWDSTLVGSTQAEAVDAFASLTTKLATTQRSEILIDQPWAYWPLADAAKTTAASNISEQSQLPLVEIASKNGPGSGAADFGDSTLSFVGDDAATTWRQSGLTSSQSINGWSLVYNSGGLPPLSGNGMTVEAWILADAAQPTGRLVLISVLNSQATLSNTGVVAQIYLQSSTDPNPGRVALALVDVNGVRTDFPQTAWGNRLGTGGTHYALATDQNAWALYVNGNQIATGTGANLPASWDILSIMGRADKLSTGNNLNGNAAHVAVYPYKVDGSRILTHFNAGIFPGLNEFSDQRIQRYLSAGGWSGARCLQFSQTFEYNAAGIAGGSIADAVLKDPVASDGGLFYVDGGSYLQYRSRYYSTNRPTKWVFGDRPDLGEVPYLGNVQWDYDATYVYNDVTASSGQGLTVTAADMVSQKQYGDRTLTRDTNITDSSGEATADVANWLLNKYRQPTWRLSTIVLDPASNPSIWPTALGVEVGDVVTVTRRPLGGPVMTGKFEVQAVGHGTAADSWRVTLTLAPADPPVLRLDDATLGQLNGSNVIGW